MNLPFTDRARKAMRLANQESQRLDHEYIGTEHILLGLVKEGAATAAEVLKRLGIDLRKVRSQVEKIVQPGPKRFTLGSLPLTPRAQKVIEFANEEAIKLNQAHVGTEHLLLGLLRETEGVASQIFANLGLSVSAVRQEILEYPNNSTETEGIIDLIQEDTGPAIRLLQEAFNADYYRCNWQLRQVILLANREAIRRKCEFIAPEHVLLGLLMQPSGPFLEALEFLGVDPRKVRRQLESLLQVGTLEDTGEGKPFSPELKRIFEYAIQEARDLDHDYLSAEHVLLGLLRVPGTAAEVVLNFFSLTDDKIRSQIRKLLPPFSGEEPELPTDQGPDLSHLSEDAKQAFWAMEAEIDRLNQEKERAVEEQDFERAAHLRDQAHQIQKRQAQILKPFTNP